MCQCAFAAQWHCVERLANAKAARGEHRRAWRARRVVSDRSWRPAILRHLSLRFDNPEARKPHDFPLDPRNKEVKEMFKEAGVDSQ